MKSLPELNNSLGENEDPIQETLRLCAKEAIIEQRERYPNKEDSLLSILAFIITFLDEIAKQSNPLLLDTSSIKSLQDYLIKAFSLLAKFFNNRESEGFNKNYAKHTIAISKDLKTRITKLLEEKEALEELKSLEADTALASAKALIEKLPSREEDLLSKPDELKETLLKRKKTFDRNVSQVFQLIKHSLEKSRSSYKEALNALYLALSEKENIIDTLKNLADIPEVRPFSETLSEYSELPIEKINEEKIRVLTKTFCYTFEKILSNSSKARRLEVVMENVSSSILESPSKGDTSKKPFKRVSLDDDEEEDIPPPIIDTQSINDFDDLPIIKTKKYEKSSSVINNPNHGKDDDSSKNNLNLDYQKIGQELKKELSGNDSSEDSLETTPTQETFLAKTVQTQADLIRDELLLIKHEGVQPQNMQRVYHSMMNIFSLFREKDTSEHHKQLVDTVISLEKNFSQLLKKSISTSYELIDGLLIVLNELSDYMKYHFDEPLSSTLLKALSTVLSLSQTLIDYPLETEIPSQKSSTLPLEDIDQPVVKSDSFSPTKDESIKEHSSETLPPKTRRVEEELSSLFRKLSSSLKGLRQDSRKYSDILVFFQNHYNTVANIKTDVSDLIDASKKATPMLESIQKSDEVIDTLADSLSQYKETLEEMKLLNTNIERVISSSSKLLRSGSQKISTMSLYDLEDILRFTSDNIKTNFLDKEKDANIHISYSCIKLESSLLKKIETIVHQLVLYSITESIEPTYIRKHKEKPESGNISIRGFRQGKLLILEIENDGSGLNPDTIRAQCIEQNLISKSDSHHFHDHELYQFIFNEKLYRGSTNNSEQEKKTNLSKIKEILNKLEGNISIKYNSNQGTIFLVSIPLDISASEILKLRVNSSYYGILMSDVSEVISLQGERSKKFYHQQRIPNKEDVFSIHTLENLLGESKEGKIKDSTSYNFLLVKHQEKSIAILVDEVLTSEEASLKRIEKSHLPQRYILGVVKEEDHEKYMLPVLDIGLLLSWVYPPSDKPSKSHQIKKTVETQPRLKEKEGITPKRIPSQIRNKHIKVLHFDSSSAITNYIRNILEEENIEVISTNSIQDALEIIATIQDIDIILMDVNPHDEKKGYKSIEEVKKHIGSKITIAVLSAHSAKSHKKKAEKHGASFFLEKPILKKELVQSLNEIFQASRQ